MLSAGDVRHPRWSIGNEIAAVVKGRGWNHIGDVGVETPLAAEPPLNPQEEAPMSPAVIHQIDKKTEVTLPRKYGRPNALRNAQVMPPHNVDLTLPPSVLDDIHVPAHVSGADLSKSGPADADAATKARLRAQ